MAPVGHARVGVQRAEDGSGDVEGRSRREAIAAWGERVADGFQGAKLARSELHEWWIIKQFPIDS